MTYSFVRVKVAVPKSRLMLLRDYLQYVTGNLVENSIEKYVRDSAENFRGAFGPDATLTIQQVGEEEV